MKKRVFSVFLIGAFAFSLYLNGNYMAGQKVEKQITLFKVNSNNFIKEENITFEEDDNYINTNQINYDHLFDKEEKIIYANKDNIPVYYNSELDNDDIAFYINKRNSEKVLGYNKFNNVYLIKHMDNKYYYIENENFLEDKNLIFDEINGTYYIKEKSIIKDYPGEEGNNIIELNINEKVELLLDNKEGYYKVKYGNVEGFIKKDNLSETKANYITDMQNKIANIAKNNAGTYPCTANYCAAWVEGVYHAAGLGYTPCFGNAIDYWNKWSSSGSSSLENIPVGAVVVGSGSGSYMGNLYGHVGVYLGNGLVAENIGRHNITDINSWINSQRGTCQGHHGFIGWVWPYNNALGEGY